MDEPPERPIVVKAEKCQQAGLDIYVAICPRCFQKRAASGLGKVACPCEAHLIFQENEP